MKNIEVCLSPELIHLFELEGKTVVVVDILRATSCMTTAFAYNISSMKPVVIAKSQTLLFMPLTD